MLILKSKITIIQQPTETYPLRDKSFIIDFVNDIEINSSWQNLTDTGKIIIPKKVYYKDELGKKFTFDGKNVISGDDLGIPLILRGDKIKIELGYIYNILQYNPITIKDEEVYKDIINTVFEGYISNVDNRMPIEIHFEDKMWLLKQVQAENKTYTGTIEEMLTEMLALVPNNPFIMSNFTSTKVGDFTTRNETIAQVLDRLQKDFRFESFIRDNELRCSYIVYYPQDIKENIFKFQYNIISDDLLYKRTDDVKIGIEAKSVELTSKGSNKDGTTKYKTNKIHYFAYYDKKELKIVPIDEKPSAFDGEIRTLYSMKMPESQLKVYLEKEIKRITYNGWRGEFTTFGLPLVKHGDIAHIIDEIIPERTGKFMIKSVKTEFGMNGFRQKVSLDLRVDLLTEEEISKGL
jgi:hypothetical protein